MRIAQDDPLLGLTFVDFLKGPMQFPTRHWPAVVLHNEMVRHTSDVFTQKGRKLS